MIIYNCHTHIFNIQCAPQDFLTEYVGKFLGKLLMPIIRTKVGAKVVLAITKNPFLKKYTSFLQIGTLVSQDSVFQRLAKNYPPETRFVVLTINFDHMGAGLSPLKYEGQLAQVVEIKKQFPDTCLPFLSIDPRMGDKQYLLGFLEKYLSLGFVGIKLYPALGYFPFDPNLEEVYRFAEEHGIPLMTHCTRSGIFYNGRIASSMVNPSGFPPGPLAIPGVNLPFRTKSVKNKHFCDNFLAPVNYKVVLQKFPKLKICIAHYGGDDEMLNKKTQSSWYGEIKRLMLLYEFVYTDVSYSLHNRKVFDIIQQDINQPDSVTIGNSTFQLGDRILFGTDYFMTEREKPEKQLAVELAEHLTPDEFKKIAYDNPKKYLSSAFYKVP